MAKKNEVKKNIIEATKEANELKIRFIAVSKNKKTGCLSQTYSDKRTCPERCPFKKSGGCYAMSGPCRLHWDKVPKYGVKPEDLSEVIADSVHTSVVRHNVAGDIAKEGTSDINEELLEKIVKAYKENKITAYTYTHCEINEHNSSLIRKAAKSGMIINYSCENLEQVKKAKEQGCNAVVEVEEMSSPIVKKDGLLLMQCPQTYNKTCCKNCGICWQKNRQAVVAFPLHGNGKKKVKEEGFLSKQ